MIYDVREYKAEKIFMKKRILKIVSFVILLFFVFLGLFFYQNKDIDYEKMSMIKSVMKQAENGEIDAVFLSMYPVETYDEEVLHTTMLLNTEILQVVLEDGEQLVGVLEEILKKPNTLKKIFLGIYAESILTETGKLPNYKSELLKQGFSWEEALLELGKAYPDKTFEMLLYYPSISYWTSLEEESVLELIDWYAYACDLYSHYDITENVHVFMPGSEEWLICNERNYLNPYQLTNSAAIDLEKQIFSDYEHIVIPMDIENRCYQLLELVKTYRKNPLPYGTLAEKTFVFLGDSVIGNYTDATSIPKVVEYMSGADTINCGFGGLAAAKDDEEDLGLTGVVECLLSKNKDRSVDLIENETTKNGILEFWEKDFSFEDENLVFFISFGINDYSVGRPIYNAKMDDSCYIGALSNAVEALQTAYPKAEIILMTPNYITIFEQGTMDNSGTGAVFQDYVDAVKKFAGQKDVNVIDVYYDLGISAENESEYLADGCHPNYYGRFKIGQMIWETMTELFARQTHE